MAATAVVVLVVGVVVYKAFEGPPSDGAVVFEMPGSTDADLTAGDWALYSPQNDDNTYFVASEDEVSVDGPGVVAERSTVSFFSDTTKVEIDGVEYEIFMYLDVPTTGRYTIDIVGDGEPGPVAVARYDDDELVGWVLVISVVVAVPLFLAGIVTLVVGLVLRGVGRRRAAA
ncbi:hypothetical protein GCM10009606_49710 [Nocardioides aquiterrae]|uniref:Uncharacterized protein n=2 Tax=Nocardioides aquiterrae TaxID=203799 RepID=A0ABN1UT80_9ACTN